MRAYSALLRVSLIRTTEFGIYSSLHAKSTANLPENVLFFEVSVHDIRSVLTLFAASSGFSAKVYSCVASNEFAYPCVWDVSVSIKAHWAYKLFEVSTISLLRSISQLEKKERSVLFIKPTWLTLSITGYVPVFVNGVPALSLSIVALIFNSKQSRSTYTIRSVLTSNSTTGALADVRGRISCS